MHEHFTPPSLSAAIFSLYPRGSQKDAYELLHPRKAYFRFIFHQPISIKLSPCNHSFESELVLLAWWIYTSFPQHRFAIPQLWIYCAAWIYLLVEGDFSSFEGHCSSTWSQSFLQIKSLFSPFLKLSNFIHLRIYTRLRYMHFRCIHLRFAHFL